MRSSKWSSELHVLLAGRVAVARWRVGQWGENHADRMMRPAMLLVLAVTAALAGMPTPARSQSSLSSVDASAGDASATSGITSPTTTSVMPDLTYVPPSERTKASNYAFDTVGPYPIVAVGVAAGINQWTNSPPKWGQGTAGFGKRFGSDFGIAAISTTAHYGLVAHPHLLPTRQCR